MKRKRHPILSSLLCAVLLAGCAPAQTGSASVPEPSGSVPDTSNSSISGPSAPEEPQDHRAVPLELPQGEVPEGTVVEYTWDHPVTVDGGRQLNLRLRCEAEYRANSWYYGVKSMDLLEGETCRQTMSIQLADAVAWFQEGLNPDYASKQTQCWEPDGNLTIEDLNFDGFPDLRLMEGVGVVNIRYLCWLWNPERQTFDYAFCLVGYDVQIDTETEQIITTARDAQTHITSYYEYDENGTLRLVDTESETPGMG